VSTLHLGASILSDWIQVPYKTKRRKPVKYYSPKRRAIYENGDVIDALTLFELHDWICYVCKEQIDSRLRMPNLMAATIEHIVPLCEGGQHVWENVAPSHAKCNFSRVH
jgi:5-methylcytosine-specific restriction endonuclease McrA